MFQQQEELDEQQPPLQKEKSTFFYGMVDGMVVDINSATDVTDGPTTTEEGIELTGFEEEKNCEVRIPAVWHTVHRGDIYTDRSGTSSSSSLVVHSRL